MGQRHTIHTLQLTHATTSLVLSDLSSAGHNVNTTTIEPDSGGPYEETSIIQQIEETFDAVTPALGTLLAALSLVQANCIESAKTYTDLLLFGRALDPCGTDGTKSGSVHRKTTASKVRLFVTRIEAQANGPVQVTLQGALLSADGDASPTTTVYNVALPTGGIVDEFFKFHGLKLESNTLDADKITSVSLDTGIRFQQAFGVKTYASGLIVTKTAPTLSIDTEDTSIEATIPKTGIALTHANTLLEFRAFDPSTGFPYATSATEHVALTVAGKARTVQPAQGSGSSPATARVEVKLTGIAGTPPITASTGQALTL